MNSLFILLLSFLLPLNAVLTKNEAKNRVKCCKFTPKIEDEYSKRNYKYVKLMDIDMAHRGYGYKYMRKIEYSVEAQKGDKLKYITEFAYKNIGNLNMVLQDSNRKPIPFRIKEIDDRRLELKSTIPNEGTYYISFSKKNISDMRYICAKVLLFKKSKDKKSE